MRERSHESDATKSVPADEAQRDYLTACLLRAVPEKLAGLSGDAQPPRMAPTGTRSLLCMLVFALGKLCATTIEVTEMNIEPGRLRLGSGPIDHPLAA